jgi:hypothetical protein
VRPGATVIGRRQDPEAIARRAPGVPARTRLRATGLRNAGRGNTARWNTGRWNTARWNTGPDFDTDFRKILSDQ